MSDTLKRVQKVIEKALGLEEGTATPEKEIVAELGADSLDFVETLFWVEDEFAIEIPDEDQEKCRTVQDVANTVDRLLAQQAASH